MSNRWPGGLIRKTPVTPTTASAVGVWTLAEALYWTKQGQWPIPGDPDFDYVSLLLPGNGTNGAQNNTFLDSSTNNFTITRNGDTTQGSFSPYGDLWSNYFPGAADNYLSAPNNAAFQFGTGDLTIEAWINLSGDTITDPDGNRQGAICSGIGATGVSNDFWFFVKGNTTTTGTGLYFRVWNGGAGTTLFNTSYTFNKGVWYHVAFTRSGNNIYLFIDGVLHASSTYTGTITAGTNPLRVGYGQTGAGTYRVPFPGYISNLRIVKGTAVYTSNFTPPTAPLTAISGTSLLTCQSNRFRDASSNNFAITRNGDVRVTNFAPFNPTAAYDPAVNGGSGYWPGTTELAGLTLGTSLLGASDFCFEFWLYVPDLSTSGGTATLMPIVSNYRFYSGTTNASINIVYNDSNQVEFILYTGGGSSTSGAPGTQLFSGADSVVRGAWNYITCTRSGATMKIYTNGVERSSGTLGSNTAVNFNTRDIYVGRYETIASGAPTSTRYFKGYISDFRLVVGSAVYTGNFTPPTAPLTAITNTSRLLRFTNAGIVDASAKNDLTTVGNAQISTAQSKFGGSSMAFDGTGDYLVAPSTPDLTLGSGDFTIEMWVYLNAQGSYNLYDQRTASSQVLPTIYTFSGQIRYWVSGADRITGSTLSANQWYHVALTRSGTSTKLFVNGTQVGATYTDTNNYIQSRLVIGANGDNVANYNLNGYIDDLRVTKGVARYTANFTPPTEPFLLK